MVCCLLSNGGIATSFYQRSANHVSFYLLSNLRNLLYLIATLAKKSKASAGEQVGVIYARYSSHAQKDASIEQQVRECLAFAKDRGVNIIDSYEDRAISGTTDKRVSFQRMMKDAEKGRFRCVVAWKSNRMGRNMLQAMMNEAKLNELGVRVMYVEEDYGDTAAGRFALRSMMNVNQFYS